MTLESQHRCNSLARNTLSSSSDLNTCYALKWSTIQKIKFNVCWYVSMCAHYKTTGLNHDMYITKTLQNSSHNTVSLAESVWILAFVWRSWLGLTASTTWSSSRQRRPNPARQTPWYKHIMLSAGLRGSYDCSTIGHVALFLFYYLVSKILVYSGELNVNKYSRFKNFPSKTNIGSTRCPNQLRLRKY